MAGHVYLIGSRRFHWYKIGKSARAAIRVTELGILLPFKVEVIAVWKAENHHELERLLHKKYVINRINGEWFSFNPKQLNNILFEMQSAKTEIAAEFSNLEKDLTISLPMTSSGVVVRKRIGELVAKTHLLQNEIIKLTRENAELKSFRFPDRAVQQGETADVNGAPYKREVAGAIPAKHVDVPSS